MKKIVFTFISCVLMFLLVGCGCENDKEKEVDNNNIKKTQIEETIENFYTDDEKLVFDNNGIYKLVFYYEGDEITGLQHYYEYEDEEIAKAQYNKDKEELKNNKSIKNISLSGKYVVYTFVGEEYEGKTVDEINKFSSFLVPVYER